MSSTNRSKARESHVADYYVTPVCEIEKFLNEFLLDEDIARPDKLLTLDPCAGGDEKNKMSYPEALKKIDIFPDTIDIREDSLALLRVNYLEHDASNLYDLIITNPPFNIAQQIIEKSLQDVRENGYVVMLLRLNYFGSKSRFPFWVKNPPKYAYVHHQRMSFVDGGATDSIEYMHCVWQKGYAPEFTKLKVI